ncbi:MAG: hypothetical protein ABIA92_02525 [Patescibacteria group bacterium]
MLPENINPEELSDLINEDKMEQAVEKKAKTKIGTELAASMARAESVPDASAEDGLPDASPVLTGVDEPDAVPADIPSVDLKPIPPVEAPKMDIGNEPEKANNLKDSNVDTVAQARKKLDAGLETADKAKGELDDASPEASAEVPKIKSELQTAIEKMSEANDPKNTPAEAFSKGIEGAIAVLGVLIEKIMELANKMSGNSPEAAQYTADKNDEKPDEDPKDGKESEDKEGAEKGNKKPKSEYEELGAKTPDEFVEMKEKKIAKNDKEVKKLTRKNEKLGTKKTELTEEISVIGEEIAEAANDPKRVKKLERTKARLEKKLNKIDDKINTNQKQIDKLENRSAKIKKDVEEFKSEVEALKTTADGLNQVINTLKSRANELDPRLGQAINGISKVEFQEGKMRVKIKFNSGEAVQALNDLAAELGVDEAVKVNGKNVVSNPPEVFMQTLKSVVEKLEANRTKKEEKKKGKKGKIEKAPEEEPTALDPAKDAPEGQVREDSDGYRWQKGEDGFWKTQEGYGPNKGSGYEGTSWSHTLMDEKGAKIIDEPAAEAPEKEPVKKPNEATAEAPEETATESDKSPTVEIPTPEPKSTKESTEVAAAPAEKTDKVPETAEEFDINECAETVQKNTDAMKYNVDVKAVNGRIEMKLRLSADPQELVTLIGHAQARGMNAEYIDESAISVDVGKKHIHSNPEKDSNGYFAKVAEQEFMDGFKVNPDDNFAAEPLDPSVGMTDTISPDDLNIA